MRMVSPAVGQANQGPGYRPQVGSLLGPKSPGPADVRLLARGGRPPPAGLQAGEPLAPPGAPAVGTGLSSGDEGAGGVSGRRQMP